jgi:hypothetical protein
MSFPAIIICGLSLMIGTLALVTKWEHRRISRFREAGVALGLRAFGEDEPLALPSVELLRKRSRTIGAALKGNWKGEPVTIFDLSYPAGKGASQTTVFMLRLPEPRIPEFAAIRKNFLDYTPTVDLPRLKHPPEALRRGWYVYAPGEQWPLSGGAVQAIAGIGRQWSCEGSGSGLFLYQRGKRTPIRNLELWMGEAMEVAREIGCHLPNTLVAETIEGSSQHSIHRNVFSFKASWKA